MLMNKNGLRKPKQTKKKLQNFKALFFFTIVENIPTIKKSINHKAK